MMSGSANTIAPAFPEAELLATMPTAEDKLHAARHQQPPDLTA